MELAVSYRLVDVKGTLVRYSYGKDFDSMQGVFEIDISKVKGEITIENEKDGYLNLIKPCDDEEDGYPILGMAFVKIYWEFQRLGEYPKEGTYTS